MQTFDHPRRLRDIPLVIAAAMLALEFPLLGVPLLLCLIRKR